MVSTTKKEALALLAKIGVDGPLPRKGRALIIANPLVRQAIDGWTVMTITALGRGWFRIEKG